MRLLHVSLVGLGVLVVSFVLDFRAVQPPSDDSTPLPTDTVSVGSEGTDPSAPVLVMDSALTSAREAVVAPEPEPVANAPCASVTAELNAALVELEKARAEIASLNAALAETMRERDRLRFGPDTPYGAFLASYEADEIDDPHILAQIEDWLRQFPVILRPGEATWIAERRGLRDWQQWGGRNFETSLILFLGASRLAHELPAERYAELRAYYADESIFD